MLSFISKDNTVFKEMIIAQYLPESWFEHFFNDKCTHRLECEKHFCKSKLTALKQYLKFYS